MKKITLFLLVALLFNSLVGQTIAWSSDCEDLTGFLIVDDDGDGLNWFNTYNAVSLGFNEGQVLASRHFYQTNNYLFTPEDVITIPETAADITFKLRVAASSESFPEESFEIYVYDEANSSDLSMIYYEMLQVGGEGTSKIISAPIPANMAGKSIGLVIRHFHENIVGEWFVIDDFEVSYTETLGIDNDLLAQSISIYPNPVTNLLNIDSEIPLKKVEIYSVLGKKVKEIKPNLSSISTHDLSSGIYLLRIESENGFAVKKIIKQ